MGSPSLDKEWAPQKKYLGTEYGGVASLGTWWVFCGVNFHLFPKQKIRVPNKYGGFDSVEIAVP